MPEAPVSHLTISDNKYDPSAPHEDLKVSSEDPIVFASEVKEKPMKKKTSFKVDGQGNNQSHT